MSQLTIDNSNRHKIQYLKALDNGVTSGDLTQYQADKLRKDFLEDLKNNGGDNGRK